MANVQLDPQAEKDLAALALGMAQDKEFRPLVNKYLKKTSNKTLPDVEMNDIRAEMKAEREAEKLEREQEKARLRLEAQREALSDRYDDAQIGEIEKLMEKEGIASYATAAKLYAADMKPAEPTHDIKSGMFEMPKFDLKNIGNSNKDAAKSAYEIIGELKQNRTKR